LIAQVASSSLGRSSHRLYPVVYLLHGYSDNDTGWLQFGEANRIADQGIADGAIPPMILVMPDGGVSFYINNFDGSVRSLATIRPNTAISAASCMAP
jgi:S-formylglutathione hydrolase FrmB